MTRPLTGPSHRTRTPTVLPIGHLSTKSSVYSPVSMSRMSQDLVQNHMKSHYQRISSAKACVDTSAPKSMKLTIKEKDRRRKEALLATSVQKTTPRSRNGEPSNSPRNSTSNLRHVNPHETSSRDQLRSEKPSSKKTPFSPRRETGNVENGDLRQTHDRRRRLNDARLNGVSVGPSVLDEQSYTRYQSTRRKMDQKSTREDSFGDQMNESSKTKPNDTLGTSDLHQTKRDNWNDLKNETFENGQYTTSTPRPNKFEVDPSLSTMTFSYKSAHDPPPTRRHPRRKTAQDLIWTEEQKYLQFISDVTSDVLARGICSNRVINKVFESHIEKRKNDLDEDNMREMIDQLKEDLGVIDD
ncbi:spermatogenesis-associated protein 7 homolog [Dendronephthya gigantea]|uniref:spermatogenesis-associated protein 7 homolog n=1 Tax=Dendronephthya gigantea TaxID=151771 RepID=UPI00106DAF9A|nr:spermatogenesis-associated protein 7 homolog [Dendronephthya gigantea]